MTTLSTTTLDAHTPTRRNFLKALPLSAAMLAAPACAGATDPDGALVAAWDRRERAHKALSTIPAYNDGPEDMEPEEERLYAIIDAAEMEIEAATAQTPKGVAIQLRVAIEHGLCDLPGDPASRHIDVDALHASRRQLDWDVRMLIAALRSLQVQGA